MSALLDLNLLPVSHFAGADHPELLGLHAAEPPRRTARGRGADRVVLYLAMAGNAPIPPAKQERLLSDLANLYYDTPGSVTSGMRVVARALNELLLDRNLRITNSGRQGIGLFTQFVVRGDQAYMAVAGPIHAFLIAADGVQHYYAPELEGRGLGQSRAPHISYYQATIKANDTMLLAAQPLADWSVSTLAGLHGHGPQSLSRRLFQQNQDVNAVLIQARPGKGKFYLLRPRSAPSIEQPDEDDEQIPLGMGVAPAFMPSQPGGDVATEQAGGIEPIMSPVEGIEEPELAVAGSELPSPVAETVEVRPASPARPRLDLSPVWKVLAMIGLPILNLFRKLGSWLGALFGRLLPEGLPSTIMAFIAIAVPVIVVTVAVVIYNQLGRTAQYDALWIQAEQAADDAMAQTDVQSRRNSWEQVLLLVRKIEAYRLTPETQALREQAMMDLDELDMVKRVDYQPTLQDHLPLGVNVTRVVISDEDLYLLDGNSGNVIRAVPAEQGFVVDDTFQCGPGPVGVSEAGVLIDMVPWPPGFLPGASVLALDDRGNVLYCAPGKPPAFDQLTESSSQAWGKPTALTVDLSDLYILDPSANAVWFYQGSDVQREPSLFFDAEIPPLDGVMDLTANNGELYLLHADGKVTLCYMGTIGVSPTRCSSTPFVDDRPGREGMDLVSLSPFSQILFTPPPDPSLFLLEPENHAVYHFSLRNLVFKRQYLPKEPLSSRAATAFFGDTVRRMLFLAIGNEVYFGVMP